MMLTYLSRTIPLTNYRAAIAAYGWSRYVSATSSCLSDSHGQERNSYPKICVPDWAEAATSTETIHFSEAEPYRVVRAMTV